MWVELTSSQMLELWRIFNIVVYRKTLNSLWAWTSATQFSWQLFMPPIAYQHDTIENTAINWQKRERERERERESRVAVHRPKTWIFVLKNCGKMAAILLYSYRKTPQISTPPKISAPSVFTEICCWMQCPESTYPPNISSPVSWKYVHNR